jgi:hypothetical protein
MVLRVSRRDLLTASVMLALTPASRAKAVPETSVTVADFLRLSTGLTGVNNLDPSVGKRFLDGLIATGQGMSLAELVHADGPTHGSQALQTLARRIVAEWYSGIYETGQGPAVATFEHALLWRALSYTKPLAYCGGEMGHWATPPQS